MRFIHHLRKCKVFPFIIIIYMIREKTFKFEVFSCFIGVKNIFMTQQNGMIFQLLSRIIIFHYEFSSSSSSFRIVFRVRQNFVKIVLLNLLLPFAVNLGALDGAWVDSKGKYFVSCRNAIS